MTKRYPIEYQIAINSNIYLSKQSRSVILNWASLLHCCKVDVYFANTCIVQPHYNAPHYSVGFNIKQAHGSQN